MYRLLIQRFLFSPHNTFFSNMHALFSAIAIMLGTCFLIVIVGVSNGLMQDLKQRIFTIEPHVFVYFQNHQNLAEAPFKADNRVQVSSRFYATQAMLINPPLRFPMTVLAFDNPDVFRTMFHGQFRPPKQHELLVGAGIAQQVGATDLTLAFSDSHNAIKTVPVHIGNRFETHIYRYDNEFIIVDRSAFPDQLSHPAGYYIWLKNPLDADVYIAKLKSQLPKGIVITSWIQMNKNLFNLMRIQKIIVLIILSLSVILSSFLVMSTMYIQVFQRTKTIGILRALGVSRFQIAWLVIFQAIILGIAGISAGLLLGFALLHYLNPVVHWLDSQSHINLLSQIGTLDNRIPYHVSIDTVLGVILFYSVIILFAVAGPARRAARLDPVEAIRYE